MVRLDHVQVSSDEHRRAGRQTQEEEQVHQVEDHGPASYRSDQADGEVEGLDAAHAEGHVDGFMVCCGQLDLLECGDPPYEPIEDQRSGCCEDARG